MPFGILPRIRAGLETMCIEHLKDDHFILKPHPMEEITRYLLQFDDQCLDSKFKLIFYHYDSLLF